MRQVFHLFERGLTSVSFNEVSSEWVFRFDDDVALQAIAPWRVVVDGRIVIGSCDEGHAFGLGDAIDARQQVRDAVGTSPVSRAWTDGPGDLHVQFGEIVTLHVFNHSAGYEGWQWFGPGERHVVALGGGRVHESESLE